MSDTKKADAPQSQSELSQDQLDAAVGGSSLADGRYTLTVLASKSIKDGTSNITDGTSNTILVGEIR